MTKVTIARLEPRLFVVSGHIRTFADRKAGRRGELSNRGFRSAKEAEAQRAKWEARLAEGDAVFAETNEARRRNVVAYLAARAARRGPEQFELF